MKWPWVSRGRYEEARERTEDLKEDRAELREERNDLQEKLNRLARGQRGMPEDPENRSRPTESRGTEVPAEIKEIINGFDDKTIRTSLLRQVKQLRKREGMSWEELETQVRLAASGETPRQSNGKRGVTAPGRSSPASESR